MTMMQSIVAGGGGAGVGNYNQYAEQAMPLSLPALIFGYTVPVGKVLKIFQLIGWGDVDAEYVIRVDAVVKGGGRSSPSERTLDLYFSAPIIASAGQYVTIYGEQHVHPTETLKINLMGVLS